MRGKIINFLFFSFLLFPSLNLFAGPPTLKTINVNGNMQDWSEVLANPNNVTLDGASASDCSYSSDRDCPVQSTGRDMVRFAWTYDSTNIYLYVERVGSSSNVQNFFFIMDVGQDRLANSEDFVLHVSYQGSNRQTNLTLYHYLPLNPAGDPLVDANGFADGYNMPGSLSSIPIGDPSYFVVSGVTGGSTSGSAFETYVPWSKLLVSSGISIFFHVASGNNASLSQVDDNLGGPGGGIGAFAYYWVQIYPDHITSISTSENISYDHTVKNNGSFYDTVDLYATSSNGLPISFYIGGTLIGLDSNGDGDFIDSGDYVNSSFDSNSDNRPDLQLNEWSSQNITVSIGTSSLPANSYDLTRIYSVSFGDNSYAYCNDETYVGDLLLYPDRNISGTPSNFVQLDHTILNNRAGDYIKFIVSSISGFSIYLYFGENLVAIDNEGNCVWDYVDPSYDSNGDGFPDLFIDHENSQQLTLYVPLPSSAVIGSTETIVFYAVGLSNEGETSVTDTVKIKEPFTLTPSFSFFDSTEKYGGAGNSVYFSHKLTNNTPYPLKFTFYASNYLPYNDSSWQISIYSDPNGDGNLSDGEIITNTSDIPGMGGEYNIVSKIEIPMSVAPPALSNSLITAVKCSTGDCSLVDENMRKSVEEDIKVSYIVPFSDNIYTISETHFTPCQRLYLKAFNLVPNQNGRYRVKIVDPSLTVLMDVSKNSDSSGSFTDEYIFEADSQSGTYKLQLLDGVNVLDENDIYVEKNGALQLSVSPIGKKLNDSLFLDYTLSNQNTYANFNATKLRFVVKDPTNSLYLKEDGTWALIGSDSYSRLINSIDVEAQSEYQGTSGFANVNYPSFGEYSICATWEFECGDNSNENDDIANSCIPFFVVSMESYSDAERTVTKDQFATSEFIYFSGEGYSPSAYFNIGIYNAAGERIIVDSSITELDGKLLFQISPSTLPTGNYRIAVFPNGVVPPINYLPNYHYELATDQFSVFQIALLRFGGVTSLNPLTPPKTDIFVNYPSDPSLSFERDLEVSNFVSGEPFSHEVSDLTDTPQLIFYQLYGVTGDSLRVSKDGGKITITY